MAAVQADQMQAGDTSGELSISREFIWAGKAIFTVSNPRGEHYTYRVTRKDPEPGGRYPTAAWFVAVLTGPNNDHDYTYLGMLLRPDAPDAPDANHVPIVPICKLTRASQYGTESRPVAVFNWAMRVLYGASTIKPGYSILHAGKCARCSRQLTDPESLRTGLGPVCREGV